MIERILICPDVHVPYEDKNAWKLFLKVGRKFKPDRIVILGDFLDAYSVSAHGGKAPDRASLLREEIAVGNARLDELQTLKAKRVDLIEGNHCFRVQRYIADKCPELFGLVSVRDLLRIKERGWHWTPYRSSLKIGSVNLIHDVGIAGAGSAAKSRDVFGGNCVIGHTHRIESSYSGNLKGEVHVGISFGWLGSTEAIDYMAKPNVARAWVHGCGVGHHDTRSGIVYLSAVPFVAGSACVDGQVVKL